MNRVSGGVVISLVLVVEDEDVDLEGVSITLDGMNVFDIFDSCSTELGNGFPDAADIVYDFVSYFLVSCLFEINFDYLIME